MEDERSSEYKAELTTEMQWKDLAPTPPATDATGQRMAPTTFYQVERFHLKFSHLFRLFFCFPSLVILLFTKYYFVILPSFYPHPNRYHGIYALQTLVFRDIWPKERCSNSKCCYCFVGHHLYSGGIIQPSSWVSILHYCIKSSSPKTSVGHF